eukprot:scaffold840_cov344-Pavlova_lutheri.AAC.40
MRWKRVPVHCPSFTCRCRAPSNIAPLPHMSNALHHVVFLTMETLYADLQLSIENGSSLRWNTSCQRRREIARGCELTRRWMLEDGL